MAVCRLMFMDFKNNIGRVCPKFGERYDDYDIVDGINYAEWLIEKGCKHEPLDDFDLNDFILWAKQKIKKD